MKIVISGVGETGFYFAKLLLQQGHDLILIEKNEDVYRYARERLDAQIILGDAANALVLEPLIEEDTDLFVAVTNSDEANILSTLIARKYGVGRALARICDPTNLIHPLLTDDAQVSLFNAEMSVAKHLVQLVGHPTADEIEFFAHGKAEMVRFHITQETDIVNKYLKDIEVPNNWIFIAVIRQGQFEIVSGETVFEIGDQVLLMGSPKKSKEIEDLFGLHADRVKRVIIVGFNEISSYLARNLSKRNIEVRLVEPDKEKAEKAAALLDSILVIHGAGTEDEVLDEAGIDQADYLLALTEDDEDNVLISLMAKQHKVSKVTALAQKDQYRKIIEKIGIDTIVNPRAAVVDEMIRSVHYKDLSGVTIIESGKGEALEIEIKEDSKAIHKPLSKSKLPKQTMIGAIVRSDKLIIPRGADKLEVGDQVVVFSANPDLQTVKKYFSGR